MKVALGFKSHSGWAALVAIGLSDGEFHVIERRRIELIDDGEMWAKMPYHAAEGLAPDESLAVVNKGVEAAHRVSYGRIKTIEKRMRGDGHQIAACAVIVPAPMPDWSTDEILAVHFRMHKAEGVLFPDALCRGADECGVAAVKIPEKQLAEYVERSMSEPFDIVMDRVVAIGRSVGPPWAKDQRLATVAAMIALSKKHDLI